MANIRNFVLLATRAKWQSNFSAEQNNIFDNFQRTPIVLTKAIYEKLSHKFTCHIRIYFGLDAADNPKVIAVPAYRLNECDAEPIEHAWDDIVKEDCIYELYSGLNITLNNAQTYIQNWAGKNENNELFIKSFLFPRSNFIEIFDVMDKDYALLDFGIQKQVKVMTQASTQSGQPLQNPVVTNNALPCPPFCDKNSILNV